MIAAALSATNHAPEVVALADRHRELLAQAIRMESWIHQRVKLDEQEKTRYTKDKP